MFHHRRKAHEPSGKSLIKYPYYKKPTTECTDTTGWGHNLLPEKRWQRGTVLCMMSKEATTEES